LTEELRKKKGEEGRNGYIATAGLNVGSLLKKRSKVKREQKEICFSRENELAQRIATSKARVIDLSKYATIIICKNSVVLRGSLLAIITMYVGGGGITWFRFSCHCGRH
jgi:hypothetical protein